jgi:hypothetical protein
MLGKFSGRPSGSDTVAGILGHACKASDDSKGSCDYHLKSRYTIVTDVPSPAPKVGRCGFGFLYNGRCKDLQ